MKKERLDKLLSSQSMMSRSDAAKRIQRGGVTVNGVVVTDPSRKIDPGSDAVLLDGEPFLYKKYIYLMMNKPAGIVSASRDPKEKTVVDLVPDSLRRPGLFPAGRLDKDTTGFVLITDDGHFAHDILSPRRHIDKTYLAETDTPIKDEFIMQMRTGMTLGDEQLLPADIEQVESKEKIIYKIVLREGKYHQIKRMIACTGATLLSLRRIRMGSLPIDEHLSPGECRELTPDELTKIACRPDE